MLSSAVLADEMYSGGVTIDIDRDVLGYLWVEDATVNLHTNAHIKNDLFYGDIYATSGSIINMYGGIIDSFLYVTTSYNGMPDPVVTVYGTDFAVNNIPLDPDTEEVFLQNEQLSGFYEDGIAFAHQVDCFWEGEIITTVKLNWIDTEPTEPEIPDIMISGQEMDFGSVELGQHTKQKMTVSNVGSAPLTIQSIFLLQDEILEFYTTTGELPLVLDPNQSIQVGLLFAPEIESEVTAILQIISDDPDTAQISIPLTAIGLPRQLTHSEQIAALIEFVETAIEEGTLEGNSQKNRYAARKLKSFQRLQKTTQRLMEKKCFKPAIHVLKVLDKKTDGEKRPNDLVKGQAVVELNEKIKTLIETLDQL